MPSPQANAVLDGISIVRSGMNSGVQPRLLPTDQVAFAVNCTFRGGLPRVRPVLRKLELTYSDETTEARSTEALFQAASFYQAYANGENCLVALIGGRMFRYLPGITSGDSVGVSELNWTGELNDSQNPEAWMWQAEDFLIVQNGAANPLFFDGASVRRSLGAAGEELEAGRMGCYVQGRVWQALTDGRSFMAGDLVYSHGFLDNYDGRSAVLKTQENTFLSGGGAFAVPISAGNITGMAAVAIADTSLGQGPLQVLTQASVYSVQVPINREEWALTEYPLMTLGLPGYGTTSQTSVVAVNGDLWYRSLDGIRSYQVGRRDLNTWVHTPLSVEVENVLNMDAPQLLNKCSGILFENRLLMTCSPYSVAGRGTPARGMIALDFNNISTLTSRSQPAYDGLWTGLPVLQIVKGTFAGLERCFIWALDEDQKICLYELLPDFQGYFDWNGEQTVGIESQLESRSMGWRDNGNELKKLLCADIYLDKLGGDDTIQFSTQYKSDEDPVWQDWHDFELCAPLQDCATENCPTFENVFEQYRTFLRLPEPRDICSQITKRMTRTGYEFQLRMTITGYWQLNRVHVWALPMRDTIVKVCPTSETCVLLKGCQPKWFSYSIE